MLEISVSEKVPQTIFDFTPEKLINREIKTAAHCFGCTAGAGSSCGGTVS
jgi:hypothetical protein